LRNRERDKEKLSTLKKEGWKTLVIWEHEVKKSPGNVAQRILKRLL
jgi:G:T-mismatch repair DNA endonuclease (very short patch repair protein)